MSDWKKERIDVRFTILFGLVLAVTSIITFGGIGFVILLFSGTLRHFPATPGMVALSSCGVLILFPVIGLLASFSNKSSYALKFWLVATSVSVTTCFVIATICFQYIASAATSKDDIERFIPTTKKRNNPDGSP